MKDKDSVFRNELHQMFNLLVLGTLMFLTGCAAIYVSPTDGSLAKVRYVNLSTTSQLLNPYAHVAFINYDNENCEGRKLITPLGLTHRNKEGYRYLGMPFAESDKYDEARALREVSVLANVPYVTRVFLSNSDNAYTYYCTLTYTFTPQEGAFYESVVEGKQPIRKCSITHTLYRLVKTDDGKYTRIKEPTYSTNTKQCPL